MTVKTFWTILIKIMGLWFVFFCLTAIAQLLSLLFFASQNGSAPGIEKILLVVGIVLVTVGIYIFILWLLVFKTSWVIEKLKLTKDFPEDRLELTIERSTILAIATIVIGGVIFIDSFPLLFKQSLSFFQHGRNFNNSQESIWIILYLVKTVLGYLLITNSRFVVNFIAKQNVKKGNGEINDLSSEEEFGSMRK